MRINAHTHVHNLTATFTRETLQILLDRLRREDYPDFLVERVHRLLRGVFEQAGVVAEPEVLLHR